MTDIAGNDLTIYEDVLKQWWSELCDCHVKQKK